MDEFDKLNKISIDKRLHGIKIKAEGLKIAAGLNKLKIPIISDILNLIKKKLGIK